MAGFCFLFLEGGGHGRMTWETDARFPPRWCAPLRS
jgi:hypothetical protein